MSVAISNIAWTASEDDALHAMLVERGVELLEVAPTRLWPSLDEVGPREGAAVAQRLADQGLTVVAFQSLLFGVEDADIFDEGEAGRRTASRLEAVIRLAGAMGAGPLVFGSPGARRPPERLDHAEALDRAAAFFRPLAATAADEGVVLCVEPNPPQYGCTFITTAAEGAELVVAVDSPGFGLHLDAAGMALAGEDGSAAVRSHAGLLRHFHVSAPRLGALETEVVDHSGLAAALADVGYGGAISVEMRAAPPHDDERVARALDLVRAEYAPLLERAA